VRILWVKAGKILPVETGGRIRSYNILRHLAARHDVRFLSYYPGERDEAYEHELPTHFSGADAFPAGAPEGPIAQILHFARHLPSRAPYSVAKFTDPAVRRRVREIVEQKWPDVVVCDFLAPSLNFPRRLPLPGVLFQHNVEHMIWVRQARHERNPVKRAVYALEAAKMRRYETAALGRFQHVVAVSDNDRSLMQAMDASTPITVVPTGVDTSTYRVDAHVGQGEQRVMFLGSMDWPANIDGVEWFCAEVWPLVRAAVPDARFQVVGRKPPVRIQRLASDSVEIVGGVESVVPYLRNAPVFIVPLRIGGGTRLKIYEAMAAERAIVSTRVGAEGLDYADGRDIVIADAPREFADAVIRLLRDRVAREAIGRAAGETAARYDWSSVSRQFEAVLSGAIESFRASRAAGQ
jgi:glycosyltransferase involved in cell wall biosynthesis